MNKLIWAPALCLALGAAAVVRAAPPVDADPSHDYAVTPDVGPWTICATYFTGPTAPDLARQMVLQIRSQHNWPAYVFNYADEERKKQQAIIDQQHPALPSGAPPDGSEYVYPIPHHHTVVHIEEQCAVLIGGFPNEDAAHNALLTVKKWPKPELKVQEGGELFSWVAYDHGKEVDLNPFVSMSMVVRNPSVPHDNTARDPGQDKFLLTLNAGEEYSMLRCPGKYTLAVKEYVGAAMVQQQQAASSNFLKGIEHSVFGDDHRGGESLAVAANDAHELAKTLEKALGKTGIKAYVLHTRTSSVVSVGAFSDPNDPAIGATAQVLAKWQQAIAVAATDPTKRDPLGLFPTPVPIAVPHPER